MQVTPEMEAKAAELEAEIAQVCGVVNAGTGRLVSLIAEVASTGAWEGWGIRSLSHWVAWKCGVSAAHARSLVAMSCRLAELPATREAFEAGELAADQVAVVVRHAPPGFDAEVAEFARQATVSQLQRTLGRYCFEPEAGPGPQEEQGEKPEPSRASFGFDDDGSWRLSALLAADQGALVERALADARSWLFDQHQGEEEVSWADALGVMAERSLASGASLRPYQDRHVVVVHLRAGQAGEPVANLHQGPGLPDGLQRLLSCDARVRPVWEALGVPVSVGRALRTVPDRTRAVVEERDRGCRVPGCDRARWSQVHHIVHWEDGGGTATANLVCLCGPHHRLHHQGRLGIEGNADEPGGLVFSDARGRTLAAHGPPAPPGRPPAEAARDLGLPTDRWRHPTGERLEAQWVGFNLVA